MVCGYGDQIGYDSLVQDICHVHVDKTSQFTDWSHRPLSPKQIHYALDDVIHLVDIYQTLDGRLSTRNRHHWVLEETQALASHELYEIDHEESWKRLKIRSGHAKDLNAAQMLSSWREQEARQDRAHRVATTTRVVQHPAVATTRVRYGHCALVATQLPTHLPLRRKPQHFGA